MQAVPEQFIYDLGTLALYASGGLQTHFEYDPKPVVMPPMVSGSIGGIRHSLTMA